MIYNGFILRKNDNLGEYIEILDPDWRDTASWNDFWYNLIIALKQIIPEWELIADYYYIKDNDNIPIEDKKAFLEKITTLEEASEYIFINTIFGKIEMKLYEPEYTTLRYDKSLSTINNVNVLDKISELLESSQHFTKLEEGEKI